MQDYISFSIFSLLIIGVRCELSVRTSLQETNVRLSCSSSLSPTWSWHSSKDGQFKMLSQNGIEPYLNFKDPRYSFFKETSVYIIQITGIQAIDAGKFVCNGNSVVEYTVSVLR
jgi:DNA-binding beta-propeller fold protein YncE